MRIHSLVVAFGALALAAQPALSQDAKLLERGTYLMNSIVACGNCHSPFDNQGRPIAELGLSGGEVFDEKPFKAYAANITPDPETGIGKWTEAQLMRGIREGIRPDGSLIGPPMPIHMYRGISDDDARALVAYLRAQPPVKNVVPKSIYHIKLPRRYGPPIKKTIVAPARNNQVNTARTWPDLSAIASTATLPTTIEAWIGKASAPAVLHSPDPGAYRCPET